MTCWWKKFLSDRENLSLNEVSWLTQLPPVIRFELRMSWRSRRWSTRWEKELALFLLMDFQQFLLQQVVVVNTLEWDLNWEIAWQWISLPLRLNSGGCRLLICSLWLILKVVETVVAEPMSA